MAGLDAAGEVGAHGVMLHLVGLTGGFHMVHDPVSSHSSRPL